VLAQLLVATPARVDELMTAIIDDPAYVQSARLQGLAITLSDIPAVNDRLRRIQREHERRMVDALARARDGGLPVRDDVDAEYVGWVWNGIILAGSYRGAIEPGTAKATIDHLRRFVTSLLVLD